MTLGRIELVVMVAVLSVVAAISFAVVHRLYDCQDRAILEKECAAVGGRLRRMEVECVSP